MKTKTLKVSHPHSDPNSVVNKRYRVEHVTNSVDYSPGQFLERDTVERLCESKNWQVTIVPPKEGSVL